MFFMTTSSSVPLARHLLICPISHEPLDRPVFTACGHSYNIDSALQAFLSLDQACSLCRTKVDTFYHSRKFSVLAKHSLASQFPKEKSAQSSEVSNALDQSVKGLAGDGSASSKTSFPISNGLITCGEPQEIVRECSVHSSVTLLVFELNIAGISAMSIKRQGQSGLFLKLSIQKFFDLESLMQHLSNLQLDFSFTKEEDKQNFVAGMLTLVGESAIIFLNQLLEVCKIENEAHLLEILGGYSRYSQIQLKKPVFQLRCGHFSDLEAECSIGPNDKGAGAGASEAVVCSNKCRVCQIESPYTDVKDFSTLFEEVQDANKIFQKDSVSKTKALCLDRQASVVFDLQAYEKEQRSLSEQHEKSRREQESLNIPEFFLVPIFDIRRAGLILASAMRHQRSEDEENTALQSTLRSTGRALAIQQLFAAMVHRIASNSRLDAETG